MTSLGCSLYNKYKSHCTPLHVVKAMLQCLVRVPLYRADNRCCGAQVKTSNRFLIGMLGVLGAATLALGPLAM